MDFPEFFRAATGHPPYDYQCRLACGERSSGQTDADWLVRGAPCESRLINIPTGLGKTAAVVLAWLWNRVGLSNEDWPRRLVYCLPMRTLVEQTAREVARWVGTLQAQAEALGLEGAASGQVAWLAKNSPIILMGGEDADPAKAEWDLHPERPAILIGTQDMLLSRALNRGYGMSRYRWPMHFGLLNNDCLWVMDETQLMGVGVETSAQLDGFRNGGRMPTFGTCPSWWMSATLDDARLAQVDHPIPDNGWPVTRLGETEQAAGRPKELLTASKRLSRAHVELSPASMKGYAKALAGLVKEHHLQDTLTLVVVNRVQRARDLYGALTAGQQPVYDEPENVALIHSRFRPVDRARHEQQLFGSGDRIVIATQAVEAGVDVSARLLITELAPWSSLVQRMGRCNRSADHTDAEVLWVDIEPDAKGELLLPYRADELDQARAALTQPTPLEDACPLALSERGKTVEPEKTIRPVLRRRDLVDLFDTTPDLCGQDLDISRYIRDGEDKDVQFFWRDVPDAGPPADEPASQRNELCRVAIGDAAKFLKGKPRAWRWDPLEAKWEPAPRAYPGGVYLLDTQTGGYRDATGWTGNPKDQPTPYRTATGESETYAANPLSMAREWQTIAAHTAQVMEETLRLTDRLRLAEPEVRTLRLAALWHDVGKSHRDFQAMLKDGPYQPTDGAAYYAKSKNPPVPSLRPGDYRRLRHELASALAWLLAGAVEAPERDLVAYLIAAHHGKVRLSIRSLPNEPAPEDDRLFARGIWDGDELPAVPLGEITTPGVVLDLGFMQMGEDPVHGPSWLARMIGLRDRPDLGPFRLAYLETLLRAADARASRETQASSKPDATSGVSSGVELREPSAPYTADQALTPAEQSLVADLVADGLSIQDRFRPEPLYKQTGQGHYESHTVEEIREAKGRKGKQP
ncbi:MAG: CRISPR-associated endonuclease Cas3'' [Verrucomicrobiales bacterium]|nr:CRISPR-associated endonuclease Cas3'' [Verrucomicrobiales bacterium]